MTETETNTEVKTTEVKTFTQDQVNAFMAEDRRKFAPDYEAMKTKAAAFDKGAEADKSELQKAIDRADAAEQKASAYEAKQQVSQWAVEIVKDSPIPASVLRGSTKEELIEHFDQLKALAVPTKQRTHVPPGKPTDGEPTGSRAAAAIREMRRGS